MFAIGMLRLFAALDRLRRRHLAGEGGFTLIELVVAMGVFGLVMSGLAFMATAAYSDIALSRNRQTASSLANQALEQVRALPYDTVALGLRSADLGSDPDVTLVGTEYVFRGERVPNGSNAEVVPLVPHRNTQVIDDLAYQVAVYVTYLDDDVTSHALRVTVIASWASDIRKGTNKFVEAQTIVFSPSDCTDVSGGSTTHPYAAPCQPYLFAETDVTPGVVALRPYSTSVEAISGLGLAEAAIWFPRERVYVQGEQIYTANAEAITSGVSYTKSDGSGQTTTRSSTAAGTDSDPSQPKPEYDAGPNVGPQASSTLSVSGGNRSLAVRSANGDTASALATVRAQAAHGCSSASPPAAVSTVQIDEMPCGRATSTLNGTTDMVADLGSLFSTTALASINASSQSAAYATHDFVPQTDSCIAVTGDGCVHASHGRAVSLATFIAIPEEMKSSTSMDLSTFTSLVQLQNYQSSVRAEAGVGNGNPVATRSGTVRYFSGVTLANPGGYTTLDLSTIVEPVSIPFQSIDVSAILNNGTELVNTRFEVSGSMQTGRVSAPACASPCESAEAVIESPVIGDIRVKATVGGTVVADFLVHIDFGTLVASAAYRPSV